MRPVANLARLAGSSAVAVALSFGAAQAMAGPAPAAPSDGRICNPEVCDRACRAIGGLGGFCTASGACLCYIDEG